VVHNMVMVYKLLTQIIIIRVAQRKRVSGSKIKLTIFWVVAIEELF
jgi:hypothetical protein